MTHSRPASTFYHTCELPDGQITRGVWDHRPVADRFELPVKDKRLLDVGCRDGFFTRLFHQQGAKVCGVDVVDRAHRRWLDEQIVGYMLPFVRANLHQLTEWNAGSWDITFLADVLEHLENPLGALRVLHHLTSERVYLVVNVHPYLEECAAVSSKGCPLLYGQQFLLDLMALAGWQRAEFLDYFEIHGPIFPSRLVGLVTAAANPDFSLPALQRDALHAFGNLELTLV